MVGPVSLRFEAGRHLSTARLIRGLEGVILARSDGVSGRDSDRRIRTEREYGESGGSGKDEEAERPYRTRKTLTGTKTMRAEGLVMMSVYYTMIQGRVMCQ